VALQRIHAAVRPLGGLTAQALAALQATFGYDEVARQRFLHVEMQSAAIGLDQAHGAGACPQPCAQLPEQLATELLGTARLGEQGGDLVKRAQLLVLVCERTGLVRNPALQGTVQIGQVSRHAVEARCQHPELVLRLDRQAHVEVASLHAPHAFLEPGDRPNDEQEHEIDKGDRSRDAEHDQPVLEHAQQRGLARDLVLHRQHQGVDLLHEALRRRAIGGEHLCARLRLLCGQEGFDGWAHLIVPARLKLVEPLLDLVCPGHHQRAGGVACGELGERFLEGRGLRPHGRGELSLRSGACRPLRQQHADVVRTHALAAHGVDCRRPALQLPREVERDADGGQRDQQEQDGNGGELSLSRRDEVIMSGSITPVLRH
jgi:hypothetical protein